MPKKPLICFLKNLNWFNEIHAPILEPTRIILFALTIFLINKLVSLVHFETFPSVNLPDDLPWPEYSGHGKSSGKFTDGNVSKWTRETSLLIKKIVKANKIILVGSSMGAWISLNQFKFFKKQIKGFLGIGSAPEFLEKLMWNKFSKKVKTTIIKNGIYNLKHGDYTYPLTLQLIKDGRKNKVLNKQIKSKLKITMIHGQKDEVVPLSYSKKILKIFRNSKKKLVIVKNGDHSLSSPEHLNLLEKELKIIIN